MRNRLAPIKNVSRLVDATEALLSRAPQSPGMALLWGHPGTGKTFTSAWLAIQYDLILVTASVLWTPKAMLERIADFVGASFACEQRKNTRRYL